MSPLLDQFTNSQKRMLICAHRDKDTLHGSLWVYELDNPKRTRIRAGGEEFKREEAHADLERLQESELLSTFKSPPAFGRVQFFVTTPGAEAADRAEAEWNAEATRLSEPARLVLLNAGQLQKETKKAVMLEPDPERDCVSVDGKEVRVPDPNSFLTELENRDLLDYCGLTTKEGGSGMYCLTPKGMTIAEALDRLEVSQ